MRQPGLTGGKTRKREDMRIMICLETRILLLTREAKRCIAYEIDQSRGRSCWLFGGLSIRIFIGNLGRFGHEYNTRAYVENNITQEQHSTRDSSLVNDIQSCYHRVPASAFNVFSYGPETARNRRPSQCAARSCVRTLPCHYFPVCSTSTHIRP
jgi:hypothetical protein